ncbi:hypothetical protein [Synoicihabitans lomoniglobus]|uniref:Uncharacterized protein n=1 Tax=Synoicihabitans lomoniglobus TaxID=2909285 RepID=A0AAF0CR20_9BACT|nr:hypothetical protein [Opitutaceae bacterium LMO-M01]WED66490.1 hypothetical protein PXH66_06465 [Opitutaceae bacterium LMO-M01]
MAITATVIGTGALVALGVALGWMLPNHGVAAFSVGIGIFAGIIALTAILFVRATVQYSRNFVTHFEIWPKSNLAVVRTAGWWNERLTLVPWIDFRTGSGELPAKSARSEALSQVMLRSGRRLIFEQTKGEAPHGWVALHRFIERCSLPEDQDTQPVDRSDPLGLPGLATLS